MRRILYIILVAALFITGCRKEEPLCLAEGEPARAYLQLGTMTPGSSSGSASGSTGLPTYEDMLRNGRDLDDDGFLNDHR